MKIGLGFVFFGIALILGQKAHASTIHDLVKTGENASVSAFLSEHPGSWNQRDEYGWLPMHWAVARGQKEIIRSLLSLDGASLSIHDKENPVGLSPFEVAVGLRQVSIAILLEPVYKPRPDEADHPAFAIDTSTRTSNLFLVHTLPGLSPDGVLKADLATDIQVKPYAWHGLGRYQGPVPGDEEFNSREPLGITPPWLASIHFTLNRVIHHERYTSPFAAGGADRAFTVVIPFRAHEGESEDPIRRITSISFSEVVLVGDYPIPMGSDRKSVV